jgi:hypothetical protein
LVAIVTGNPDDTIEFARKGGIQGQRGGKKLGETRILGPGGDGEQHQDNGEGQEAPGGLIVGIQKSYLLHKQLGLSFINKKTSVFLWIWGLSLDFGTGFSRGSTYKTEKPGQTLALAGLSSEK